MRRRKARFSESKFHALPRSPITTLAAPPVASRGSCGSASKSLTVASGTKSDTGPGACVRNHSTAATGGVRIESPSTRMPNPATFATSAERGRDVVLVRNRCGMCCSRSQRTASDAPGTACSPS